MPGKAHLFIIFDLIFSDDSIGVMWFLPGELYTPLLHFLLDDLADLGRCCLDKNMSISRGRVQAQTQRQPTCPSQRPLMNIHRGASKCLHLIKIPITFKQRKILKSEDYEWQSSLINSNISSELLRKPLSGLKGLYLSPLDARRMYANYFRLFPWLTKVSGCWD